jgi:hypothetical protein
MPMASIRRWFLLSITLIITVSFSNDARSQEINWNGNGNGIDWGDPANWNGGEIPGSSNFARVLNLDGTIELNSDQAIDGASITSNLQHSGGTLTVDREFSFDAPRDGPSLVYSMSGNARLFSRGSPTNLGGRGSSQLTMRGTTSILATQSLNLNFSGVFNGRLEDDSSIVVTQELFAGAIGSGSTILTMTDRSVLIAGQLLLSPPTPDPAGSSELSFIGGSLFLSFGDLLVDDMGLLSYKADSLGVSTLMTDQITLSAGAMLSVDLSGYESDASIRLIDADQPINGIFSGLPEGALVPGTNGRTISYLGGDGFDVVLVPEPQSALLLTIALLVPLVRTRKR